MAAGHPAPAVYSRGPRDFERLCDTEGLDLVYTATSWEWHVPVMLAAMKAGKHAATEVSAAMTLDDCWALVEAAEKHRRHAVMMENCNYDRAGMMALDLVRRGVIGEMAKAESLPRELGPGSDNGGSLTPRPVSWRAFPTNRTR